MSIDDATPEEWDRSARAARTAATWAETGFSLQTLNAHLARPFGEVALVDRCLAFALWQQGHPVQAKSDEFDAIPMAGEWVGCTTPQWDTSRRYRIVAKPEALVLPSIDWSAVVRRLNWLAQDPSGCAALFSIEPDADLDSGWSSDHGDVASAQNFSSFKPGKGDWRKLIVQRPEGA